MGAIGIVSLPLLVLLWVTPDLPVMISEKSIRRLFFAMLIVDLCVPAYYTIQIAGLPWISARRIVTFALIVLFAIAISSSSATRQQIVTTLKDARGIAICAFGFLVMVVLSVFTSIDPGESLSQMSEVILNWYVPFVALLYAIRSEKNIFLLVRIIAICALFIALAGVAEFLVQRRLFVEAMPKSLVESLMAANPTFADFVNSSPYRNGVWRAASVYLTSLSLGEFGAMVAPLGFFYLAHGRGAGDRSFGLTIVIAGLVAIASSGSRGGYLGFILASAMFIAMWTVRAMRFNRGSLAPALVGLCASIGFAAPHPVDPVLATPA